MLHPLQDVVIVVLILVDLWWNIIETEITLLSTSKQHVWKDTGQSTIAILKRMDAHKPEMSDGWTDNTAHLLFPIKPDEKFLHFLFYTIWRRSNIMNLLASEHSTDNVLLVCTVFANLYLTAFAVAWWKESGLPSTQLLFTEGHVIVLYRFKHYTNNRIDIMRWRGIFHVLNAKLSGNGRTNLINVQPYAFYLRRIYHIVCQVLCHCTQLAVKSQRTQPAVKQTLLTEYFFLKEWHLRSIPAEVRPIVSFVYIHNVFVLCAT